MVQLDSRNSEIISDKTKLCKSKRTTQLCKSKRTTKLCKSKRTDQHYAYTTPCQPQVSRSLFQDCKPPHSSWLKVRHDRQQHTRYHPELPHLYHNNNKEKCLQVKHVISGPTITVTCIIASDGEAWNRYSVIRMTIWECEQ